MSSDEPENPLAYKKIAHEIPVSEEVLRDAQELQSAMTAYWDLSPAERQERERAARQAREAQYAAVLQWHDRNIARWSVGPLAKGLLELHRPEPDEHGPVCHGCDTGEPESYYPEFPCRTYVFVARYIGAPLTDAGQPVLG